MCKKPYISKPIKYPDFVITDKIDYNGDSHYRYTLYIPFNASSLSAEQHDKGTVVVILKNPSSASNDGCDRTISKVCNAAKHNGYTGVIIANLFPYRATRAKDVINFYKDKDYAKIMKKNFEIICQICKNKDTVFAWGTNTIGDPEKYDKAINDITANITNRTFCVKPNLRKNCKRTNPHSYFNHKQRLYPLHGLRWHNDSDFIPY